MLGKALLLSIKPEYAEKIFNGEKKVELRRVLPKVANGDLVIVYVSSPVKALVGVLKVDRVISAELSILWEKVNMEAGITKAQFDNYFAGLTRGYGIYFSEIWVLPKPIQLQKLRQLWPGFRPPQGYKYLNMLGDEINLFSTVQQSIN